MSEQTFSQTQYKRPRGLRWLCAGLAIIGVLDLVAGLRVMRTATGYIALGVSFPPALAAILQVGWGATFLYVAYGLWRLRNRARREGFLLIGVYSAFEIIWWRVFARSDYALVRWPFAVLAVALLVILAYWYLNRPPVRALFRDRVSGISPTDT